MLCTRRKHSSHPLEAENLEIPSLFVMVLASVWIARPVTRMPDTF